MINNHGFGMGFGFGFFKINFWFWIGMRCELLAYDHFVTHGGMCCGFLMEEMYQSGYSIFVCKNEIHICS